MEAHRPDLIGRAGIAGTPEFGVRAVTGSGTLTATDSIVVANNGATNITLTLPTGALRTVRGVTVGRVITIKRGSGSTGNVTINAPAGGTVQSCTNTLATYGATTALNTSNANSATFVIEGLNVSASQMLESGRINHQGARNLTVIRVTCTELGVITHNCPTAGTDTISDTNLSGRAQMSMTQTGANPVNVQWSRLSGISGTLNVTGTTGTVGILALNRITADNGTVTASSTGAATIQFITVTGSSNVTVSTASPITASQIAVSEAGQVNITGATGNVSNVHVWSAGSVTIPGGQVNALQKSCSSTLNTGAFAHTNIGHHTGTSKTLTAANTNRVDHMGLAAQLV